MKKKSANMKTNGIYCDDKCPGLIGDTRCKEARCRVHGGKMELDNEHFLRCKSCLDCWPVKEGGGNG